MMRLGIGCAVAWAAFVVAGCGSGSNSSHTDFRGSAEAACAGLQLTLDAPVTAASRNAAVTQRLGEVADAASSLTRVSAPPAQRAAWDLLQGVTGRQLTTLTDYRTAVIRGATATQRRLRLRLERLDRQSSRLARGVGVSRCGVTFAAAVGGESVASSADPGASARRDVRRLVEEYQLAVFHGDAKRACRLVTANARREIAKAGRATFGPTDCLGAAREAGRGERASLAARYATVSEQRAVFRGILNGAAMHMRLVDADHAVVAPFGAPMGVVRVAGRWKIDHLPYRLPARKTSAATTPASGRAEATFVQAADAICRKQTATAVRLIRPVAPYMTSWEVVVLHAQQIAAAFSRAFAAADPGLKQLKALHAPPRLARAWRRYLAISDQQEAAGRKIIAGLRTSDPSGSAQSMLAKSPLDAAAARAGAAAGVKDCT